MALYDKITAETNQKTKAIRDEIEKIGYHDQKVDRVFVDKIATLLADKYGKSPTLTELYEKYGMKVKPKKEKGKGSTKNKLEIVREKVTSVKETIDKLFKDEKDDTTIGVMKLYIEPLVENLEKFLKNSASSPVDNKQDEDEETNEQDKKPDVMHELVGAAA